jgi:hypothetical protein
MAYSVLAYLYETPTSHICCLFMTLLSSTHEQLRQRGYPGLCSLHLLSIYCLL